MAPGTEGGLTSLQPEGELLSIFDAAMSYGAEKVPLVVIAGKDYGSGSSRDWAAKGPSLLGVRAVIAESFERIHRANLVGFGILPLEFMDGEGRKKYNISGEETFNILGINSSLTPGCVIECHIFRLDKIVAKVKLRCRIDTNTELQYFLHGGILQYVLRELI